MKLFRLWRTQDDTGVSGTGWVAEGVEFDTGKCALSWLRGPKGAGRSVCIYDTLDDLIAIHGHDGSTTVKYLQ